MEVNQLNLLNKKLIEKIGVLEEKIAINEQNSQVQQLLPSKSLSNYTSTNEEDTLPSESETKLWYVLPFITLFTNFLPLKLFSKSAFYLKLKTKIAELKLKYDEDTGVLLKQM